MLAADDDARADPAGSRRLLEDIRRLRRDDPARAGEASIEREIEARKRDGRIDTPEEVTATRYKLRLDAQARRGVPEKQRRLITNDERAALATEYLRTESSQGKSAADAWLDGKAQKLGANAARFKTELVTSQFRSAVLLQEPLTKPRRQIAELPGTTVDAAPSHDAGEGNVVPVQDQRRSESPDTEARKARARRVLEQYSTFRRNNRSATDEERDAALERIVLEEGELPIEIAQRLVSRLRRLRDEREIGTFIDGARRIVRIADTLPHSIGPQGIPKETLRVARKIVELVERDSAEAQRNPRKVILDGIQAAGKEAADDGEVIDPMIPFAVGMTIDALRRRGTNKPRRERSWTPEQRDAARKQLPVNKSAGDRAETQIREVIMRDIEVMKVAPQAKRLVRVEGRRGTIPDLPLGTKHDQIEVFVEAKRFGARHRDPQRRRLRKIGAHYVEIDPDTGASRAQVPPYENWITYEEWLRLLEGELVRKSRP